MPYVPCIHCNGRGYTISTCISCKFRDYSASGKCRTCREKKEMCSYCEGTGVAWKGHKPPPQKESNTLMHKAAFDGDIEKMKWLHESEGVDVNVRDNRNSTPMHYAASEGRLEVMEWLKRQRAAVNVRNNEGSTPMHKAASNGHLAVMKWLQAQDDVSIDINEANNRGETALDLAISNHHKESEQWLKDNGAVEREVRKKEERIKREQHEKNKLEQKKRLRKDFFRSAVTIAALISVFALASVFAFYFGNKPIEESESLVQIEPQTNSKTERIEEPQSIVQIEPVQQYEPEPVAAPLPSVGNIIQFGDYGWRVLAVEDSKALLLSDKIIEVRAYHSQGGAVTWEDSDIRKYLNTEFLNSFSQADRNRIAETKVVTNNNPWYGTNGGSSTTDKIFLLSLEEILQYFGDSGRLNNRQGQEGWFSDQYSQSRIAYNKAGTASWWWLRSPGIRTYSAAGVRNDGDVDVNGCLVYHHSVGGGVRPALWLNLESEIF